MRTKNKYMLTGFLFVLPSLLYYLFVFLGPLLLSFYNSLCKVNLLLGTQTFIGLKKLFQFIFQGILLAVVEYHTKICSDVGTNDSYCRFIYC